MLVPNLSKMVKMEENRFLIHEHLSCLASAAHQRLDGFPVRDGDGLVLVGLAVCWGSRDAYYVSLEQEQSAGEDAHTHTHTHVQLQLSFFCLPLLRFKLQSRSSPLG